MSWKRATERRVRPLLRTYARMTRGLTLGVRGMVFDGEGRVLLVHHTYVSGWHLPGGGVEKHETVEEALARELVEEAGVRIEGAPTLLSIHAMGAKFRGDHVLTYRIDQWSACPATSRGEIEAVEWFAPDALPPTVTLGTRHRIEEALGRRKRTPFW